MARTRNIKPGFFMNDELGQLDPLARILFAGMWCHADFRGCLEYRPARIKAAILPYDDVDVAPLVTSLCKSRALIAYSDGVQIYVRITNFLSHQHPHPNEIKAGTKIPDPDSDAVHVVDFNEVIASNYLSGPLIEQTLTDQALSLIPSSLSLIPSPLSLYTETEELKGVKYIFEYWLQVMNKSQKTKLTAGRRRKIKARLKSYPVQDLARAIDGCANSPFHMGANDNKTLYNDLELIFRSDTKLEEFRDSVGAGNGSNKFTVKASEIAQDDFRLPDGGNRSPVRDDGADVSGTLSGESGTVIEGSAEDVGNTTGGVQRLPD